MDDVIPRNEERPTGIAGVDRGIGLDRTDVGGLLILPHRHGPVEGTHDPRGHGEVQTQGCTDSDDSVSHTRLLFGRANRDKVATVGPTLHFEDGNVVTRIASHDAHRKAPTIGEDRFDSTVIGKRRVNHVVIRDDVAAISKDESRPRTGFKTRINDDGHNGWQGRTRNPGDGVRRSRCRGYRARRRRPGRASVGRDPQGDPQTQGTPGDAQDPSTDHSDEGKDSDVPSPQRTPGAGTGHEAIVPPHRWTRILGPRLLT